MWLQLDGYVAVDVCEDVGTVALWVIRWLDDRWISVSHCCKQCLG